MKYILPLYKMCQSSVSKVHTYSPEVVSSETTKIFVKLKMVIKCINWLSEMGLCPFYPLFCHSQGSDQEVSLLSVSESLH